MEGRALNPDMLCRDSEEPACRGGMLPNDSAGQGPDSLAAKLSRCKARLRQGYGVQWRVWRTFCRLSASVALAKEARYKVG
jgi:hypothetical protein